MARDIRVKVVGDDKSFQAAMRRANLTADKSGEHFKAMGKHIVGGLAAFAGVSVGIGLVEESVKAAQHAEVAHALLAQQMKNVGLSFKENGPEIEHFTESLSKMSGFTGTELTSAFTGLVRVTKDVGKAQDDLRIAVDLARLKHIDLATATSLVTKAQIGMVGGLRRVGIDVSKVTVNVDALRKAHDVAAAAAKAHGQTIEKISKEQLDAAKAADKAATATAALAKLHKSSTGAAEAYGKTSAGAMARFQAAIEHLQVQAGSVLLPTMARLSEKAIKFVDDWGKAGTTANEFRKSLHSMSVVAQDLLAGLNGIVAAVGGWGAVFKVASDSVKIATSQFRDLAKAITIVKNLTGHGGSSSDFGGGKKGKGAGGGGNFSAADITGGSIVATATGAAASPNANASSFHLPGERTPYDCSAFTQAVFSKSGISIGSTTYSQVAGGRPVKRSDIQAGDLVFFNYPGERSPGHVGIAISSSMMVHDHGASRGVSQQPIDFDHYVTARCYIKGHVHAGASKSSGGGGGGAAPPTAATPSFKTTATKAGAAVSFDLPVPIKTSLSLAALTKKTSDDLLALNQARKFIESKLGSLTGEQKLQALDALKGVNDQIAGIEDTAHAKQKAAQDRQKAAVKAHLDAMKAIVTAKQAAFASAFTALVDRAMAGFDRATAAGLAGIQARFGAQTPEEQRLADFQAKRAADDLAKSRADALAGAATDEERAALALGYSLDDQEAGLKAAADASRANADKQQADAESAYQDLRDLQKTQLQAWLDDQQRKLSAGTAQWADFWKELVGRAGMAGVDTGSAFWKGFSAAGSAASGDLGALSSSKVAAVMSLPGGGSGPLDPAIAAAILARGKVYDSGGWLPSGGLAMNLSGKPEAVLTGAQLAGVAGGRGGDVYLTTTVMLPDGSVLGKTVQKWAKQDLDRGGAGVPG